MQGTKTARSMSYTGCWTCRRRRVKCDEKPGACRTCTDAKLECGGYDVRLIWDAGSKARKRDQQVSRRRIQSGTNASICMTEDKVAKSLSKIDKAAMQKGTTVAGPFTVFVLSDIHPPSEGSPTHTMTAGSEEDSHDQESSVQDEETGDLVDKGGWLDPATLSSTSGDDFEDWHSRPRTAINNSDQTTTVRSDWDVTLTDQLACMTEYPTHAMTGSSNETSSTPIRTIEDDGGGEDEDGLVPRDYDLGDTTVAAVTPQNIDNMALQQVVPLNRFRRTLEMDTAPSGPSTGLCSLIDSDFELSRSFIDKSTTEILVNHYTEHIVHLMQPIAHEGNPFRTIYLPLAISGLKGVENPGLFSSASVAAFHSLLSTAALNLQDHVPGDAYLKQVAWHHKQRALTTLRSGLMSSSGSYKELMTAMLSLVSTDIIEGGISDHWVHLGAAVRLQASRHYGSFVSHETQLLNSICTMLHLFSQTALPQELEAEPWPGSYHVSNGADSLHSSIEFIYGITPTLARAIFQIHRLTQHIAYYKDQQYPASLMKAAEDLGDKLHSWTISSEQFPSLCSSQEYTLKIVRAQARAFHSAALLYYYRSIQCSPRDSLRSEQQAVMAAMNEAENLKVEHGGETYHPAPITWPAFIASCEAVGQDRKNWEKYWERIQSYRMGNYRQQLSTIHNIWADLDDDVPGKDWRECLAARGVRIIPV